MAAFLSIFFFFNDTATTEIYTLSLHDALPIFYTFVRWNYFFTNPPLSITEAELREAFGIIDRGLAIRSEEHTSELQSRLHLVCRLLLEKKNDVFEARLDELGAIHNCRGYLARE